MKDFAMGTWFSLAVAGVTQEVIIAFKQQFFLSDNWLFVDLSEHTNRLERARKWPMGFLSININRSTFKWNA